MRVGLVGLSTPIFYDYAYQASLAPSDLSDSPNPIIEGAFGALLLYDEVWFVCRSLCPENMRGLPYVRFLDEEGRLPEIDPDWLGDPTETFASDALEHFHQSSRDYQKVKTQAHVTWDAAADNHTHGIRIGDARLAGDSWSPNNVLYDVLLTERFPSNVELLTNSFSSRLLSMESAVNDRLQVTELLVLENVPQFISPHGPYHECVEELRESDYLRFFRKWIGEEISTSSRKEALEIKREVESKLRHSQERLLLRYLEPKAVFRTAAETLIGIGVDTLSGGAGTLFDVMGKLRDERKKKGMRWQGFIVEAQRTIRGV